MLQGVTGCYEGLQGVTRGNRGLQGYTRGTQPKLISVNKISRKLVFTIKMKIVTNRKRVIYILGINLHNAGKCTMFVGVSFGE